MDEADEEAREQDDEERSRDVGQSTAEKAKVKKRPHQRFTREQTSRLASPLKTRGQVPKLADTRLWLKGQGKASGGQDGEAGTC